jgi:hypothetical protein
VSVAEPRESACCDLSQLSLPLIPLQRRNVLAALVLRKKSSMVHGGATVHCQIWTDPEILPVADLGVSERSESDCLASRRVRMIGGRASPELLHLSPMLLHRCVARVQDSLKKISALQIWPILGRRVANSNQRPLKKTKEMAGMAAGMVAGMAAGMAAETVNSEALDLTGETWVHHQVLPKKATGDAHGLLVTPVSLVFSLTLITHWFRHI